MNRVKLKNYSTTVPASRTISQIEQILASFGAEAIFKEYTADGKAHKLSFKLGERVFKLPANVKGVYEVLYGEKQDYYGTDSMKKRDDQAYRVAWRILKDWIHAQLSLIHSGQAQPQEIFFPYMYDGKRTLYQKFIEEGKLLESRKGDE